MRGYSPTCPFDPRTRSLNFPHARPFTVAELADRFGSLPAARIHTSPAPGTATREDADRLRAEGHRCEWVENTLIERAASQETAFVAARIIDLLSRIVHDRELGWSSGLTGSSTCTAGRSSGPRTSVWC